MQVLNLETALIMEEVLETWLPEQNTISVHGVITS